MKKIIYIDGVTKINNFVFVKEAPMKTKHRYGVFKCHCDNLFEACISHIKSGKISSCGCSTGSRISLSKITHGKTNHKIYKIYKSMKERILLKTSKAYKYYGAVGIIICDEWLNDFMSFYNWAIENGYEKGLSIDRIDNNGNYEPSNCRWATKYTQQQNQRVLRNTNTTGYRGVTLSHSKKYVARIHYNNTAYYLGTFMSAIEAAEEYDKFVIEHKTQHNRNFN